jgi:hypothetical protein
MTRALENARYFRWFDSGDVYSVALAEKILSVMERTPHTKHWLPTRSYKFAKFAAVLERMGALPNVMVRYSSDSVTGEYVPYLHGSTITPASQPAPEGAYLCPATASPAHDGKCGACRACYDKGVPVVAYVAHGRTMAKIVRKELDKRGVS